MAANYRAVYERYQKSNTELLQRLDGIREQIDSEKLARLKLEAEFAELRKRFDEKKRQQKRLQRTKNAQRQQTVIHTPKEVPENTDAVYIRQLEMTLN